LDRLGIDDGGMDCWLVDIARRWGMDVVVVEEAVVEEAGVVEARSDLRDEQPMETEPDGKLELVPKCISRTGANAWRRRSMDQWRIDIEGTDNCYIG
jgi:hypothetical protein